MSAEAAPIVVDVRRYALRNDGSVAEHFRDENGAWDTIVYPPGGMVVQKFADFVDYAEEI